MDSLPNLLQQGSAWVYFPTAVILGALHGLEPGHSKTMMAAFIIAVRGTIVQAVLLGLSAAFSHSLIIWAIAALALRFGEKWNVETTEPYFQMIGGVIVIAMAFWTFWRMRREAGEESHHHHDEPKRFMTALGSGRLEIMEEDVPPHFLAWISEPSSFSSVSVHTLRSSGETQAFNLTLQGDHWETAEPIPEPHQFTAEIRLSKNDRDAMTQVEFVEAHDHAHGDEENDAHARAHAAEIANRFSNRAVTTPQIILFGLTGGLMPCPAAFSILIICIQLKKFALGFSLVAAFSLGLALTLVSVGVLAAWSLRQAARRFSGFGKFARMAPYISLAVLLTLGTFLFARGLIHVI